jgi:hypothetical protein
MAGDHVLSIIERNLTLEPIINAVSRILGSNVESPWKWKWFHWCLLSASFQSMFLLNLNLINYVSNSNSTIEDASTKENLSTIHLAFGLSGNHPGFLSEFEVALKSVLLHAPLDRDMHVHIVADRDAYQSLGGIFNRTGLSTWETRNSIEIHAYDITPDLPQLEHLIVDTFAPMFDDAKFDVLGHSTSDHTIGCFFRLFANRVIPITVKHLVYMDTDVVIMANLEELWRQVEATPDALFHWGRGMCSGFMVLNIPRADEIWTLAQASPVKNISDTYRQKVNDQLVLISVNVTYPDEVAILEDGWDMTITNRWKKNHQPYDKKYPNVGMLHFKGMSGGNFF